MIPYGDEKLNFFFIPSKDHGTQFYDQLKQKYFETG